jgi:hypothetical protein
MRSYLPRGLSIGMLLLAIWLILAGALPLLGMGSPALGMIQNGLAIAAGICLLLGR